VSWVVTGGAGFVGSAICRRLHDAGEDVVAIDAVASASPWRALERDLLVDDATLPEGRVVLALGSSNPRALRPWTLALDNAITTARLARGLRGREVTLISSIEIYGAAPAPLREDTEPALAAAAAPCPPHRVVGLCRELAGWDPSGRWTYALSKLAQELILEQALGPGRATVLRLANVTGAAQYRLVGQLVESMLEERPCTVHDSCRSFVSIDDVARVAHAVTEPGVVNVSAGTLELPVVAELVADELGCEAAIRVAPAPVGDSCGVVDSSRLMARIGELEGAAVAVRRAAREFAEPTGPMFRQPLEVVVPPRPEQPDAVADRIAASIWTGKVRGGRWTAALADALSEHLELGDGQRLVLTNSGTNALRLAIRALAGPPRPGAVALCPAFTFHATVEVLRQLGWTPRFADVDEATWTLAPDAVAQALATGEDIGLVVTVDALGNPSDYAALNAICGDAGVPLIGDSAPALGALYAGLPVGTQASAHALSLSFAKVVSGGGSGGALVLPASAELDTPENWLRSSAISEASAIVALDGLSVLDDLVQRRAMVAEVLAGALAADGSMAQQVVRQGDRHAWVHWVMRVSPEIGRDELARGLAVEGVRTRPYYEPMAGVPPGAAPVTARLHDEVLALPMSSELTRGQAEQVAAATLRVRRAIRSAGRPDGGLTGAVAMT
jgi:dTDP-4-amino-4,6-dideoxygalactose transaminase/nucleoside-diphosphate-sugar epimerase